MLEKMLESYMAMEPAMKTFVSLRAAASFVLFVQMLFILIVGGDVDFDLGEVGEGGGTGIFSVRSIGSFFVGFGWTGAMLLEKGYSVGVATLGGAIMGSIILSAFLAMMRWMQSLKSDGTIDYKNAIGNIGTVYIPISPRRKGIGQIEVQVQGRLAVVGAVTDDEKKLDARTAVRVKDLIDTRTLLVARLETESTNKEISSPTET